MRRICEVSGRPLSVGLLQRPGQPVDTYRRVLEGFEAAARDGLVMRGQAAARPTGLLLSLWRSGQPAGAVTHLPVDAATTIPSAAAAA